MRERHLFWVIVGLCGHLGSKAWLSRPPARLHRHVHLSSTLDTPVDSSAPAIEQSDEDLQRQLRFGGVGRLFGASVDEQQLALNRLRQSVVTVIGLGGVGSWAAEALCRSGVGNIILIDLDDICISNTNRQIHTLSSTIGRMKVDAVRNRLVDIHPHCIVNCIHDFVSEGNLKEIFAELLSQNVTMILDAIDGGAEKAALLAACVEHGVPVVTCGGAAGRMDPTKIVYGDLTEVTSDKLLRTVRKTLRQDFRK